MFTGNSEQLIVTSIKHEDGSPPTNIIKKEPVNQSTASTSGGGSSSAAANDSNNNNDAKDPLSTAMDDKDGVNNDSSLTDECKLNYAQNILLIISA